MEALYAVISGSDTVLSEVAVEAAFVATLARGLRVGVSKARLFLERCSVLV